MANELEIVTSRPSTISTQVSQRSVREIAAEIEAIDPARPGCALLPLNECAALIEAADRLAVRPEPELASRLTRTLVGVYRKDDVGDPAAYVLAIAATLAEFPAFIAERVASPVHGLPSRLKFLPSIAEVRSALETEEARQRSIVARARWMIQERERRERAERERLNAPRVDPARVDEILAKFRKGEAA